MHKEKENQPYELAHINEQISIQALDLVASERECFEKTHLYTHNNWARIHKNVDEKVFSVQIYYWECMF